MEASVWQLLNTDHYPNYQINQNFSINTTLTIEYQRGKRSHCLVPSKQTNAAFYIIQLIFTCIVLIMDDTPLQHLQNWLQIYNITHTPNKYRCLWAIVPRIGITKPDSKLYDYIYPTYSMLLVFHRWYWKQITWCLNVPNISTTTFSSKTSCNRNLTANVKDII